MSDEEEVLDPAAIARLRALADAVARPGEDVLGHLSKLFIEDSTQRLATLRRAWSAGETAEAARAAHTIKGAAGNVGAARVMRAAEDVEAAIASAAPFSEDRVAVLARELDAAWTSLRRLFLNG